MSAPDALPLRLPAEPGVRGAVLLLGVGAEAAQARRGEEVLREAGFGVYHLDPSWRLPAGGSAQEDLADTVVIGDVGHARRRLPEGAPRFLVGFGVAGLHARLAACAVLGFDGAVALGGRVSHAGVDANHPIQPLDLLPGLGCPLQCHFDADDPLSAAAHVDELERRLRSGSRPSQVFRYPEGGGGWRGRAADTAWGRARSFLLHLAAGRP